MSIIDNIDEIAKTFGWDKTATDVTGQAAERFHTHYIKLPARLKAKLSLADLRDIFKEMVVPALDHARALDRAGRAGNNPHCPYTCCTVTGEANCKCTVDRMLGSVRAIPEFLADQETMFAALGELALRIECCGASLELTRASSLCNDIRQAVGNKYNPPNHYAADRVQAALSSDGEA